MPKKKTTLQLYQLSLRVNLGWPAQERQKKQTVLLNIDIAFPQAPQACETDELADTTCYESLIKIIRKKIAKKNYRLIEHLSREIYFIASTYLPNKTKIKITLTKFPPINKLKNASFCYGDF